ncbi:hypothetical protein, partial [Desulfovibrio cuneatus]|uniref:hypothetical protein n=1 Tax=Desulfovibrio cuneatus TaxID=159728 RepID=UPI0012EC8981
MSAKKKNQGKLQAKKEAMSNNDVSDKTLLLSVPAENERKTYSLAKTQAMHLLFDPAQGSFERAEDNLLITFPGNKIIVIENFYANEGANAPEKLILADGTELVVNEFLANINPDLATAAAKVAAPPSNGLDDYSDGAGNLISGVERLGALASAFNDEGKAVASLDGIFLAPEIDEENVPIAQAELLLSIQDASIIEGGNLTFSLSQSATSGATTSGNWSITLPAAGGTPGTASLDDLDDSQFAALGITVIDNLNGTYTLSGIFVITSGNTATTILIPTKSDAAIEGNERFLIEITDVQNASLGNNVGVG